MGDPAPLHVSPKRGSPWTTGSQPPAPPTCHRRGHYPPSWSLWSAPWSAPRVHPLVRPLVRPRFRPRVRPCLVASPPGLCKPRPFLCGASGAWALDPVCPCLQMTQLNPQPCFFRHSGSDTPTVEVPAPTSPLETGRSPGCRGADTARRPTWAPRPGADQGGAEGARTAISAKAGRRGSRRAGRGVEGAPAVGARLQPHGPQGPGATACGSEGRQVSPRLFHRPCPAGGGGGAQAKPGRGRCRTRGGGGACGCDGGAPHSRRHGDVIGGPSEGEAEMTALPAVASRGGPS